MFLLHWVSVAECIFVAIAFELLVVAQVGSVSSGSNPGSLVLKSEFEHWTTRSLYYYIEILNNFWTLHWNYVAGPECTNDQLTWSLGHQPMPWEFKSTYVGFRKIWQERKWRQSCWGEALRKAEWWMNMHVFRSKAFLQASSLGSFQNITDGRVSQQAQYLTFLHVSKGATVTFLTSMAECGLWNLFQQ